jgi:hypothetical protein
VTEWSMGRSEAAVSSEGADLLFGVVNPSGKVADLLPEVGGGHSVGRETRALSGHRRVETHRRVMIRRAGWPCHSCRD